MVDHFLGNGATVRWKCRFQMLRIALRLDMEIVPKFILATSILHIVGKYLNDNYDPEPDFKDEEEPGDEYDGDPTNIGGNSSADKTRCYCSTSGNGAN